MSTEQDTGQKRLRKWTSRLDEAKDDPQALSAFFMALREEAETLTREGQALWSLHRALLELHSLSQRESSDLPHA